MTDIENDTKKDKPKIFSGSFWNNLLGIIASISTIFLLYMNYQQYNTIQEQVRLIQTQNDKYVELQGTEQVKKERLQEGFNKQVENYDEEINTLRNEIDNNKNLNEEQKKELRKQISDLEQDKAKLNGIIDNYKKILKDTIKVTNIPDTTCQIALAKAKIEINLLKEVIFDNTIKEKLKIYFKTIEVSFPDSKNAKISFTYDTQELKNWAEQYKEKDNEFVLRVKTMSFKKKDDSEILINYKSGNKLSKEYEEEIHTFSKSHKVFITFTNEDGYFGKPFIGNRFFLFNIQTVAKKSQKVLKEIEVYGIVKDGQLVLPSGNIY